jgi:hypothetical protein
MKKYSHVMSIDQKRHLYQLPGDIAQESVGYRSDHENLRQCGASIYKAKETIGVQHITTSRDYLTRQQANQLPLLIFKQHNSMTETDGFSTTLGHSQTLVTR